MKRVNFVWPLAAASIALGALSASAADAPQAPQKPQARQVYGHQLMTDQERLEYRNKMRSFKTQKERDEFRAEHHKLMQDRAKEKGVTLPDEPPMRRGGMGPKGMGKDGMRQGGGMHGGNGTGMGMGMDKGQGMGPGTSPGTNPPPATEAPAK